MGRIVGIVVGTVCILAAISILLTMSQGEFGTETTTAMADGCRTLAMLWDSAWAEGGGNQIEQTKIRKITQKSLQKIYESQDFVPSKALGKIDPYL